MDDRLKPGDFVKLTRHLSFGDILLGEGSPALILAIPDEYDFNNPLTDALVLADDRLIRVPDWWLRKNSIVLVG